MHNEKIDARCDRPAERLQAGVHRGADPGDAPVVSNLEPVARARRIREFEAACALVAIGGELG